MYILLMLYHHRRLFANLRHRYRLLLILCRLFRLYFLLLCLLVFVLVLFPNLRRRFRLLLILALVLPRNCLFVRLKLQIFSNQRSHNLYYLNIGQLGYCLQYHLLLHVPMKRRHFRLLLRLSLFFARRGDHREEIRPHSSTVHRLSNPRCSSPWQSRQSSSRLSGLSVTVGSLMFSGVRCRL